MSILNWASARPLRHINRATAMHAIFHMLLSPWISQIGIFAHCPADTCRYEKRAHWLCNLLGLFPLTLHVSQKARLCQYCGSLPKGAQRHDCSRELRLCLLQMEAACSSSQALPSSHRPSGKSFWKGGTRGGRTFFQKGFPPRKLFFLHIFRHLPAVPKTKKSPAERGQKKTPSRCELQGGLEQSLAAAYFPT